MNDQKVQIVDRLQKANNILITVSKNPSVDQLSAAIGLTLVLNKLGKHAIAVFSGTTPSTIEFLQPEKTFEKTTDSLRDFIISLDKAKADKLRYKVEDQMVKIFITPYRTSLSQDDLNFSQGDYNVEVVLALGVNEQTDLDQAITSHGRILHDATVIGVNAGAPTSLGSINWAEQSSSLSEMLTSLSVQLKADALDSQVANAFLTGIVAETNRFSNEKTSPNTMQASSQLMAAGANQQLVSTQLQKPDGLTSSAPQEVAVPKPDGELDIAHSSEEPAASLPEPEAKEPDTPQIHINEHGEIGLPADEPASVPDSPQDAALPNDNEEPAKTSRSMALEPPTLGGKLTANTERESLDPSVDIIGAGAVSPQNRPVLTRDSSTTPVLQPAEEASTPAPEPVVEPEPMLAPTPEPAAPLAAPNINDILSSQSPADEPAIIAPTPEPVAAPEPVKSPEPAPAPESTSPTLTDLEQNVDSPHLEQPAEPEQSLDAARDAVMEAMQQTEARPEPIAALNAQPLEPAAPAPDSAAPPVDTTPSDPDVPAGLFATEDVPQIIDPAAPPSVPPPFTPPSGGGQNPQ